MLSFLDKENILGHLYPEKIVFFLKRQYLKKGKNVFHTSISGKFSIGRNSVPAGGTGTGTGTGISAGIQNKFRPEPVPVDH